jgi:hypothetical protein
VLVALRAGGCPMPADLCLAAASSGDLDTLRWAWGVAEPTDRHWRRDVLQRCVGHDRTEALMWVAEMVPVTGSVWRLLLLSGDADAARQVHRRHPTGPPLNVRTANCAAGCLSLLQWVRSLGCPWDETTSSMADLESLRWMRSLPEAERCPWDQYTVREAIRRDDVALAEWAHANGCPAPPDVCALAARTGSIPMMEWARRAGFEWGERVCVIAASLDDIDMLAWVRSRGCPWGPAVCMAAAASFGRQVAEWGRRQEPDWPWRTHNYTGELLLL